MEKTATVDRASVVKSKHSGQISVVTAKRANGWSTYAFWANGSNKMGVCQDWRLAVATHAKVEQIVKDW